MIWIENDLLYFRKYNNDCIRIDMIKSYDNFFRKEFASYDIFINYI